MIYYSLCDITSLGEGDINVIRDKIGHHFIGRSNLKRPESVAAKALLCVMLERQFGLKDFTVDCDENGKPFMFSGGMYFNLSHSGVYVLCAVGDEKVGCDVQQIKPYNQRVVERFFTADEASVLKESSQQAADFTRLWTLKESVLKFSGEGVAAGLDRYDFSGYYKKNTFRTGGLFYNIFQLPEYIVSICCQGSEILPLQIKSDELKIERGTL